MKREATGAVEGWMRAAGELDRGKEARGERRVEPTLRWSGDLARWRGLAS